MVAFGTLFHARCGRGLLDEEMLIKSFLAEFSATGLNAFARVLPERFGRGSEFARVNDGGDVGEQFGGIRRDDSIRMGDKVQVADESGIHGPVLSKEEVATSCGAGGSGEEHRVLGWWMTVEGDDGHGQLFDGFVDEESGVVSEDIWMDGKWKMELPGISRLHPVDDPFLALFVPYVGLPCGERNADGLG